LASAKGKNLTPIEKRHLRGLLCGCSPSEIAKKLNKSVKGLEESGYKSQPIENQLQSTNPTPLDAKVHIENINIKGNKIEIGILIQVAFTSK